MTVTAFAPKFMKIGVLTESWGPYPNVLGLRDGLRELGYRVTTQPFRLPGGRVSRNVVARTPGEARVLIGAHLDGARGSPAANDNASGIAVLLEAARELRSRPGIVLVAFGAEERGEHFADIRHVLDDEDVKVLARLDRFFLGHDARTDAPIEGGEAAQLGFRPHGAQQLEVPALEHGRAHQTGDPDAGSVFDDGKEVRVPVRGEGEGADELPDVLLLLERAEQILVGVAQRAELHGAKVAAVWVHRNCRLHRGRLRRGGRGPGTVTALAVASRTIGADPQATLRAIRPVLDPSRAEDWYELLGPLAEHLEELVRDKHLLTAEHTLEHWPEELYLPGPMVDRTNWENTVISYYGFGGAIALVSCYRGFHCTPGAEGVGRATTMLVRASCENGHSRTRKRLHAASINGVRTGQSTSVQCRITSRSARFRIAPTSCGVSQFCSSSGDASPSFRAAGLSGTPAKSPLAGVPMRQRQSSVTTDTQ